MAVLARSLTALWIVAALVLAPTPTQAAPGADHQAQVTVSPSSGTQYDTFTFRGTGFYSNELIGISFMSPAGEMFSSYTDGAPITVTTDPRGSFTFSVRPWDDFAGSAPGRWSAAFCDAETCFEGPFTITLGAQAPAQPPRPVAQPVAPPPSSRPPAAPPPSSRPASSRGGNIGVTPASGSQYDAFTFTGAGLPARIMLAVVFRGPAGEEYSTYTDGSPITVQADNTGRFDFVVYPWDDFGGSSFGTWTAAFCEAGGPQDCWSCPSAAPHGTRREHGRAGLGLPGDRASAFGFPERRLAQPGLAPRSSIDQPRPVRRAERRGTGADPDVAFFMHRPAVEPKPTDALIGALRLFFNRLTTTVTSESEIDQRASAEALGRTGKKLTRSSAAAHARDVVDCARQSGGGVPTVDQLRTRSLSRRGFVLSAGAAGGVLLAGCAPLPFQRPPPTPVKVHRVGFLSATNLTVNAPDMDQLRQGLAEFGYVEGQHFTFEYRGSDGNNALQAALAAELVRLPVEVIVVKAPTSAHTARGASTTVPIVHVGGGDLVATGLAASLARPGGTVTGVSAISALNSKRLQLLKQAVPAIARVAIVWSAMTDGPFAASAVPSAAQDLGMAVDLLEPGGSDDIDAVLATAAGRGAQALLVTLGPLASARRAPIVQFAARHRWPAIYFQRQFVDEGGLMAYGPDETDLWRRAAAFVDKILRGVDPAEIPLEQPTRFDFVVNTQTARALDLTFPREIMLQTTQTIG